MADVLLVHGACSDGSSWDLVAPALRARGHRVHAIDLQLDTLAADTAAAQEVVDAFQGGGGVVVCGHSYGGMVITGLRLAAGSHLVYLAAFMPDESESSYGLLGSSPSDFAKVMHVNDAGRVVLEGAGIDEICWGDATADQAAKARASIRSMSPKPALETPAACAWRDVPSTYVVCRQDRVIAPDLQRQMAQRATHVVAWDSSHCPNLAHATSVVDLLEGLAQV